MYTHTHTRTHTHTHTHTHTGPTDFLERVEKMLEKKEETKRLLAQATLMQPLTNVFSC